MAPTKASQRWATPGSGIRCSAYLAAIAFYDQSRSSTGMKEKHQHTHKHTHTLSRLSPLTTGTIVSTPVSSNEDDDWSMTKEYFDWSTIRQRRHS
ncbi:hypothetical protein T10_620 [Trichinella papuae]|uniref:Uncharacterized protein n=1 Tax=Trichinella papuae TaxID=268474 RepID=A0A0V1MQ49_9BILA|nr:hypothetical protein T10_620 [Trichinella papuae]